MEPATSTNLPGYSGENPKSYNNTSSDAKSRKLGYTGENPTPGDAASSKNTTSDAKSRLLGVTGENPTTDTKQTNITTSATIDANNATAEVGTATVDATNATADADAALVDAMSAEFILLYNATNAFNIKDLSATQMAKVK